MSNKEISANKRVLPILFIQNLEEIAYQIQAIKYKGNHGHPVLFRLSLNPMHFTISLINTVYLITIFFGQIEV